MKNFKIDGLKYHLSGLEAAEHEMVACKQAFIVQEKKEWIDKRKHSVCTVFFYGQVFSYLGALDYELTKVGGDYSKCKEIWSQIKALKCRLCNDGDEFYYSPLTKKYCIKYDFGISNAEIVLKDNKALSEAIQKFIENFYENNAA